jgi:hypothetical protein
MRIKDLFEAVEKTAVTAFGRLNPPTIGHQKLVEAIKKIPGDHFLFLSHTQDHKENPLPFDQKLKFANAFFDGITIGEAGVNTAIKMMQKLEQLGYTDVIMVAGSDRVDAWENLLPKQNGIDYNFKSIKIHNAGMRDPDAEGVEGMSAGKMRAAAIADNFDDFASGVPRIDLADELFAAVKAGLIKPPKKAPVRKEK